MEALQFTGTKYQCLQKIQYFIVIDMLWFMSTVITKKIVSARTENIFKSYNVPLSLGTIFLEFCF